MINKELLIMIRDGVLDRENALRILLSGYNGVFLFNLYRNRKGELPNLSGAWLANSNLASVNLAGADLSRSNLAGTDLSRSNLAHAQLARSNFVRANLVGAKLANASVVWANLNEAKVAGADLAEADLTSARLVQADLAGADLTSSKLHRADLTGAYLSKANFSRADLTGAILIRADFAHADLSRADFSGADLAEADLTGTDLTGTNFFGANLTRTNFADSSCRETIFSGVDLSQTIGLDHVRHNGPNCIGSDTLSRSDGRIPEIFLRGCGLSSWEILSSHLHKTGLTPTRFVQIQYDILDLWMKGKEMINGCFVSYSSKDADFVEKLRHCLMAEEITVWLDRHDMVAGTIEDQVWRAIQLHHVVILVLSKDSIRSDWVGNELDIAREKEKREGRTVLCPIAVDDDWKRKIDASLSPGDPNRALWLTLREKLVVDFSAWKTKAFGEAFRKLLRGLRVNYGPKDSPDS